MDIGEIGLLKFEHLPRAVLENIAESPYKSILDVIKLLPLDKSVPLMMQIILNCSPQEVAEYHNVSVQSVYKKNKLTISIIKTYQEN